jgi:hypothetical protein
LLQPPFLSRSRERDGPSAARRVGGGTPTFSLGGLCQPNCGKLPRFRAEGGSPGARNGTVIDTLAPPRYERLPTKNAVRLV